MKKFRDVEKEALSGDLLMFKWSDAVAEIAALAQRADNGRPEYSHVALAIRERDLKAKRLVGADPVFGEGVGLGRDRLLVLDEFSFYSNPRDIYGNRPDGAQIRLAASETETADACAWLPLSDTVRMRACISPETIESVVSMHLGTKFKFDVVEGIATVARPLRPAARALAACGLCDVLCPCLVYGCLRRWDGRPWCCCETAAGRGSRSRYPEVAKRWAICSELVARAYVDLGVLPPETRTEEVSPTDFLPRSCDPREGMSADADRVGGVPLLFSRVIEFEL
jgi:hypothetical protein